MLCPCKNMKHILFLSLYIFLASCCRNASLDWHCGNSHANPDPTTSNHTPADLNV